MKVMRSVRGRITTKLIYLTLSFSPALPAFRAQRFPTRACGKWLELAAHGTAPHDRLTVHKWKLVHLFSGAEAPAFRQGVSAVSSLEWSTGGVLRHAACEQSARCDSPLPTEPGGLLAGNVASVQCLASPDGVTPLLRTHAPEGAHAAGLRSCRAAVMQPDAAPLSFRGSCKPLALAMGFMTPPTVATK